ncbi:MAG TPA: hypothetical protein VN903_04990 [Polyangia bacterium]|nr:hypothetical protein [Polyangia bacterium]
MLFAVLAGGFALSASGCFVESSGPSCVPHETSDPNCIPDLTISWQIVRNGTNIALTCAEAGNANTVTAWIDGGGYCGNLVAFDSDCLANQTQGSFIAQLPAPGTYNVSLDLLTGGPGGTVLSTTNVLVQPVGCAGAATPVAPLGVNF